MTIDYIVIAIYLSVILGVGWLGWFKAKTREDYSVAGRQLGPVLFTSTMAATILGGASTIGTIGLGYRYGISGLWLPASLGFGIIGLSLFMVSPLIRLKLHTVTQILALRYRPSVKLVGSIVMMIYDLMVAVTSTIAIGNVLSTLLKISMVGAIWGGGAVVVAYAVLGGMWSLARTDILQFTLKTLGLLFVLMPLSVIHAGGWRHMAAVLPAHYFSLTAIGLPTITTYFLIYSLGILIGQDIWQRAFTARSGSVAKWGGLTAGIYCILWGVMGGVIGMSARVYLPALANPESAFVVAIETVLPVGIKGVVIAAALAALMSTASACMMATSTIAIYDVYTAIAGKEKCSIIIDRLSTLIVGIIMLLIASLIGNVVAALTVAYNLLVGALLIPLIGAVFWKRASSTGAIIAILLGGITVISFIINDGLLSNSPIYYGLGVNLIAFMAGSLLRPDRVFKPPVSRL
ncbi:sodium:solute symporter [Atlantibacter subterranea]|uniref:Sodium:solute symporter n=1 Tax=Atlantibacter subterraneus TaxID=255519 RepID=A0A3R9F1H4_9ENTR|nr:sodium:solute symporter [Atlantibacter subterranea]MDA3131372.1 sodium:solute symporter [Atlantibacter subterranea]RSB61019.1 sodium:solute symporter [Atlantibacter subterranea]RSE05465.1 sodium:solute symporter [Atlantibacter subterranea]RSE23834.1 sodium:solute symporter [Atlantibacter subterranea]